LLFLYVVFLFILHCSLPPCVVVILFSSCIVVLALHCSFSLCVVHFPFVLLFCVVCSHLTLLLLLAPALRYCLPYIATTYYCSPYVVTTCYVLLLLYYSSSFVLLFVEVLYFRLPAMCRLELGTLEN
jgi:hypothetical protein